MANRKMAPLFFILLLFSVQAHAAFSMLSAQDLEGDVPSVPDVYSGNKVVTLKKMQFVFVDGRWMLRDASARNPLTNTSPSKKVGKACIVWVFGD